MRRNSASLSTPQGAALQRRAPRPLYAFVVTALAVFLAGLAISRTPVRGYVAAAAVARMNLSNGGLSDGPQHSAAFTSTFNESSVRDQVMAEESLRDAWRLVGESSGEKSERLTAAELEELRRAVSARIVPQRDGAEPRIVIECTDRLPGRAMSFADQLARIFVKSQAQPPNTPVAEPLAPDAGAAVTDAIARERETRQALDAFLDSHFLEVAASRPAARQTHSGTDQTASGDTDTVRQDSGRRPGRVAKTPVSPPATDPQWQTLMDRRDELTSTRKEMLNRFTPAHPRVIELDEDIEEVEQRLEKTPRFLTDDPQSQQLNGARGLDLSNAGAPSEASPLSDESPSLDAVRLAESVKEYERLRDEHEAARRLRKQLEQSRASATPRVTAAAAAWLVETARITKQLGGPAPASRILLLGLLSLLLGGLMSWLAHTITGMRTFPDVASVQQRLPIPVVAEIPRKGGPSPNPLARRSGVVRTVILVCELTLACCVLACVVVALAGGPPAPRFAEDPFGVVMDVFLRAAQRRV